jgi:rhodanese-related sulfurtransferase
MAWLGRLFGSQGAAQTRWIEPEVLATRMQDETPPVVIDVRGPDEFEGPLGHIAGARNVPLDRVQIAPEELAREERPIVMVCHTDRRSGAAAQAVACAGGRDVSVLRGGMVAWRANGL